MYQNVHALKYMSILILSIFSSSNCSRHQEFDESSNLLQPHHNILSESQNEKCEKLQIIRKRQLPESMHYNVVDYDKYGPNLAKTRCFRDSEKGETTMPSSDEINNVLLNGRTALYSNDLINPVYMHPIIDLCSSLGSTPSDSLENPFSNTLGGPNCPLYGLRQLHTTQNGIFSTSDNPIHVPSPLFENELARSSVPLHERAAGIDLMISPFCQNTDENVNNTLITNSCNSNKYPRFEGVKEIFNTTNQSSGLVLCDSYISSDLKNESYYCSGLEPKLSGSSMINCDSLDIHDKYSDSTSVSPNKTSIVLKENPIHHIGSITDHQLLIPNRLYRNPDGYLKDSQLKSSTSFINDPIIFLESAQKEKFESSNMSTADASTRNKHIDSSDLSSAVSINDLETILSQYPVFGHSAGLFERIGDNFSCINTSCGSEKVNESICIENNLGKISIEDSLLLDDIQEICYREIQNRGNDTESESHSSVDPNTSLNNLDTLYQKTKTLEQNQTKDQDHSYSDRTTVVPTLSQLSIQPQQDQKALNRHTSFVIDAVLNLKYRKKNLNALECLKSRYTFPKPKCARNPETDLIFLVNLREKCQTEDLFFNKNQNQQPSKLLFSSTPDIRNQNDCCFRLSFESKSTIMDQKNYAFFLDKCGIDAIKDIQQSIRNPTDKSSDLIDFINLFSIKNFTTYNGEIFLQYCFLEKDDIMNSNLHFDLMEALKSEFKTFKFYSKNYNSLEYSKFGSHIPQVSYDQASEVVLDPIKEFVLEILPQLQKLTIDSSFSELCIVFIDVIRVASRFINILSTAAIEEITLKKDCLCKKSFCQVKDYIKYIFWDDSSEYNSKKYATCSAFHYLKKDCKKRLVIRILLHNIIQSYFLHIDPFPRGCETSWIKERFKKHALVLKILFTQNFPRDALKRFFSDDGLLLNEIEQMLLNE